MQNSKKKSPGAILIQSARLEFAWLDSGVGIQAIAGG